MQPPPSQPVSTGTAQWRGSPDPGELAHRGPGGLGVTEMTASVRSRKRGRDREGRRAGASCSPTEPRAEGTGRLCGLPGSQLGGARRALGSGLSLPLTRWVTWTSHCLSLSLPPANGSIGWPPLELEKGLVHTGARSCGCSAPRTAAVTVANQRKMRWRPSSLLGTCLSLETAQCVS